MYRFPVDILYSEQMTDVFVPWAFFFSPQCSVRAELWPLTSVCSSLSHRSQWMRHTLHTQSGSPAIRKDRPDKKHWRSQRHLLLLLAALTLIEIWRSGVEISRNIRLHSIQNPLTQHLILYLSKYIWLLLWDIWLWYHSVNKAIAVWLRLLYKWSSWCTQRAADWI